jgi:hypothetical protein
LNKIVLTKKTSAIFLAIVLVTGTIALAFPSFMIGAAQALPYYGQDNNYDKKSDAKNVSVKSIKCNNVNVNVNGLELDGLPPSLGGLLNGGEGDEGQYGANSYGSNGYGGQQSGYDNKNSFKFVCINNNNNTVIGGGEPIPPIPPIPPTPPVEDECLLCFEETTQAVRDAINAFLAAQGDITVAPGIVIPANVNNFEQLCEWLTENAPLELTRTQIFNLISQFLRANPTLDRGEVQELVECLIDADLIELTTCDDCFAALPENVQAAVNSILETIPPEGLPQDTTPQLIIPTTVGSIPELCEFLENNIRSVTPEQRDSLISTFADVPGSSQEIATALIDCLIDVGIFNLIQPE